MAFCRFQEQLLDAKAQLSKVVKDKEALEGSVGRLEKQRAALDNEVTQVGTAVRVPKWHFVTSDHWNGGPERGERNRQHERRISCACR